MEAGLGNNPFYVWQSLLAARDLIREGSIWQVGDGRTIEVSTHKWLSHKPVFIGEPQPNLMVSELIDENSRQWDREKPFDLFAYHTRMEIMVIPLSRVASRDKLNWKENKRKVFSVKSTYQVALRLKQLDYVEHSTAARDRPIWNKIWSLKVPPKVKNFMWRACSNILPTRDNLHRRKLHVEPMCGFCCQNSKTAEHVLWTCPFARNVWALCRGKLQKCSNVAIDFFSLFQLLVDRLECDELKKWAMVSWALWTARNKFYFERTQWHPKRILGEALGYLREYHRLCNSQR